MSTEEINYIINETDSITLTGVEKRDIEGIYRYVARNIIGGPLQPSDFFSYKDEFSNKTDRNSKKNQLFSRRPKSNSFYAISFFISADIKHMIFIRQEMDKSFGNKSIAMGNLLSKGYTEVSDSEYITKKKPGEIISDTFHVDCWKYSQVNYADFIPDFQVVFAE